jgi:hypothetical protein
MTEKTPGGTFMPHAALRRIEQKEAPMQVQEMISSHPDVKGNTAERLLRCIEHCYGCAQTCVSCADACVAEPDVEKLRQCIRLNLDCADICIATGAMGSRRTGSNVAVLRAAIEACEIACRTCGEECQRHAGHHEHCRVCADACMRCADACRDALSEVH